MFLDSERSSTSQASFEFGKKYLLVVENFTYPSRSEEVEIL